MRGKPSTSGGQSADGEGLARAGASPVRVSILDVLSMDGGRTLSAEELSIELQAEVSTVRYHARVLELIGVLEIAGEELGLDFYERFYRAKGRPSTPLAGFE
jgi:DNA-binding transcriptional ArsR family regulator